MTLLDFARGPAMQWSLIILVLGVVLRLFGALLLARTKGLSQGRGTHYVQAGLRTVLTRMAPMPGLEKGVRFSTYAGYVWHIGLLITVLFLAPHIEWFKSILGFGWPNLPNSVVVLSAAVTLAILVALLVRRIVHPVLKVISSFDDYFSWLVTVLPVVTGLMAYAHMGTQWGWRYETLLGVHILSVELLFVYLPFGKLIHPFTVGFTRYATGTAMEHRGVRA